MRKRNSPGRPRDSVGDRPPKQRAGDQDPRARLGKRQIDIAPIAAARTLPDYGRGSPALQVEVNAAGRVERRVCDLCRAHNASRMTPAMARGVADRVGTIAALIDATLTANRPGQHVGGIGSGMPRP